MIFTRIKILFFLLLRLCSWRVNPICGCACMFFGKGFCRKCTSKIYHSGLLKLNLIISTIEMVHGVVFLIELMKFIVCFVAPNSPWRYPQPPQINATMELAKDEIWRRFLLTKQHVQVCQHVGFQELLNPQSDIIIAFVPQNHKKWRLEGLEIISYTL